ncbi:MAG: hypothetical protein PVH77_05590 [Phycisphaerales bacterium]
MEKECRKCKSFEPTIYPLHCGDPNRETIMDGVCQKDQERNDADDCSDSFEAQDQEPQLQGNLSQQIKKKRSY